MTSRSPRYVRAGVAFALTLATASLVWLNGRSVGLRETASPAGTSTDALNSVAAPQPAHAGSSDAESARKLADARLLARNARTTEEQRAAGRTLYELARSAHFAGKGGEMLSLEAYQEALRLARAVKDRNLEADVLIDLSETLRLLGRPAEAETALRSVIALREAGVGTPEQLADTLFRYGDFQRVRGNYAEARKTLDRSLRMRQREGHEPGQADCLSALGQVALEEGSLALARQLFQEAARLFAKNGKVESRAAVLGQLGDAALSEGAVSEAESLYQEGLAVWQERKQGFWTGRFLTRRAKAALKQGELERARQFAEEGRRLLAASNGPVAQAGALLVLGEVARRNGNIGEAKTLLARAEAQYQAAGYLFGLAQCRSLSTRLRSDSSRPSETD
jgi:tetratricopeptide (TPR) repeat protein